MLNTNYFTVKKNNFYVYKWLIFRRSSSRLCGTGRTTRVFSLSSALPSIQIGSSSQEYNQSIKWSSPMDQNNRTQWFYQFLKQVCVIGSFFKCWRYFPLVWHFHSNYCSPKYESFMNTWYIWYLIINYWLKQRGHVGAALLWENVGTVLRLFLLVISFFN